MRLPTILCARFFMPVPVMRLMRVHRIWLKPMVKPGLLLAAMFPDSSMLWPLMGKLPIPYISEVNLQAPEETPQFKIWLYGMDRVFPALVFMVPMVTFSRWTIVITYMIGAIRMCDTHS